MQDAGCSVLPTAYCRLATGSLLPKTIITKARRAATRRTTMTLLIATQERINGVNVFKDDQSPYRYYLIADQPRIRQRDDHTLAFRFMEYRNPIERSDGRKGGGYLVFDTELVVSDAQRQAVVTELQNRINKQFPEDAPKPQVEIATLVYTRGTSKINLESLSKDFVEDVFNPGGPSLYGRNITPFSVELTENGATLLAQALQGKGGFVQVVYDLYCPVKLPPCKVDIWFDSSQFYSFWQTYRVTTEDQGFFSSFWRCLFGGGSQDEKRVSQTMQEATSRSQWGGIHIEQGWPSGTTEAAQKSDAELLTKIQDWAFATLADAIKRMTLDPVKPVSEEQRKVPDGATDFQQYISNYEFNSFSQTFTEERVVEWHLPSQGMIEPITNMLDKDGNSLRWEDYASTVDLDDPFFKTLEVPVRVNADFKDLPLDSVEVHLDYNEGSVHQINEYSFNSPDKLEKFKSYIENAKWTYNYYYQVNYKGESRAFQSALKTTDEKFLTINVGDTGILAVDILQGDLNWTQVAQAQVTLRYEPSSPEVQPIEQEFILDKSNTQRSLREVIFEPVGKAYQYRVKYTMVNGKEYATDWKASRQPRLYIDDPFGATKTITLVAVGDLDKDIATIYVDMRYVDDRNGYTQAPPSTIALSKAQPFFNWSFPAIDDTIGKLIYSGSILFKNRAEVEEIPEQSAETARILVGVKDAVQVEVRPNLIDFAKVSLAQVSLHYQDDANQIDELKDLFFDASNKAPQTWTVPLKDKAKQQYEWKAVFYMNDAAQSVRETPMTPATGPSIVLRVPAA